MPKTKTAKMKSPIEKETTPQSDQLSGLPEQEAKVSRTPEVELDSPSSTSFNKISAIAYTVVVNRVQSRSLLSGTIWAAPEYYTSACPEFFVTWRSWGAEGIWRFAAWRDYPACKGGGIV